MPSRWYEVFPLVLLEALSVGTPVVVPDHGGFPDIVSHGNDGLLFAPNDELSLSAALRYALQIDEESWQQLSDNTRSDYLRRFTPEANYPLLMATYEKAIENNKGRKKA
jgi:glycosyltransferase involved in cell wall biosynthesis